MTEIQEYYAEKDKEYWNEDDEPYQFQPEIDDLIEWLAEQDDLLGDFLDDMLKRSRENKKSTIYVMLADWLDDHYREIKDFIN